MKHLLSPFILSIIALFAVCGSVVGQTAIIPKLYLPSRNTPSGADGWVINKANVDNSKNDYWKLLSGSSLISPEINLSTYSDVSVTLNIQSFGSINGHSDDVTLHISEDDMATWVQVGVNQHTTASATTVSLPVSSTASSVHFKISVPNATSSSGARLMSCEIYGTQSTTTPSLNTIPAVLFGDVNVNSTTSKNVTIKGANLTGDLSIAVAGDGFSSATTSISKADAEAGTEVAIGFNPTVVGAASGTVTITGGGLASSVVVNLSGNALSIDPMLDTIAAVDFGTVSIETSSTHDILIKGRNISGDLTVIVAGEGFTGSATVTAAEANSTDGKSVSITFSPATAAAASGTVTISGGGLANSVVVNLTGVGSNAVTVFSESFVGFSNGQPNVNADGADVSGSLNSYTTQSGWSGSKVYAAGGSVKMGTGSALGWIQTPQIDLSANEGVFTISFKAMAWKGDATSLSVYVNGVKTEVTGMSADDNYVFSDFGLTLTGGTSTTVIKFEGKQASKSRFFIDDLVITQETATPTISAANLSFGTVNINTPTTKPLTVVGVNLSGEITVAVAGEGFSTTTPTLTKEGGEASISFTGTAKGDYTGTVTLSNDTTTVTYDLTATAIDPSEFVVATIADLKAKETTDQTNVFTLTGDVTFVFRNGRNIYVQDATAGLLIYDNSSSVITSTYVEGDVISGGIKGKITEFNGQFEFIPTENTAASTQNTGAVTPESIGLSTLVSNYAQYDSRLVNLPGVTFASGSFTTEAVTNLDITQDGVTIACRNAFRTLDVTPAVVSNVRGFVSNFKGVAQIFPRSNNDIFITVGCDPNEVSSVKVINLPEGVLVEQANEGDLITVFAANGTEVARQKATSSSETVSLGKGFFVVKVGNAVHKVIR